MKTIQKEGKRKEIGDETPCLSNTQNKMEKMKKKKEGKERKLERHTFKRENSESAGREVGRKE